MLYSIWLGHARRNKQTRNLLIATLVTMAIGIVYWAAVILPQRGKAWVLLEAAKDA